MTTAAGVAPVMGPIMATTAAVVMGSVPRAVRAFALVVVGTVGVVLLAYLLSWVVPDVTISFTSNPEITSRIRPGIYALLTAMGAGAAGAFITARPEITDALAGVAIAISLVPPLCVVGISLQQGQTEAAAGAALLFLTNSVAVLLAGGVVFFLLGLGKAVASRELRRFRRRALLLYLVGLLLVGIPLAASGYETVVRAQANASATADVQKWLAGTSYQVDTVSVTDGTVAVTIAGSGPTNSPQQLANQLATTLGEPVVVRLRTLPEQTVASSNP
jgi:uncharacterized hydrophobic protein (TIGR00271 family)